MDNSYIVHTKKLCLQFPERYLHLTSTVAIVLVEAEQLLECQHWWGGNVTKTHRDDQCQCSHIFYNNTHKF